VFDATMEKLLNNIINTKKQDNNFHFMVRCSTSINKKFAVKHIFILK